MQNQLRRKIHFCGFCYFSFVLGEESLGSPETLFKKNICLIHKIRMEILVKVLSAFPIIPPSILTGVLQNEIKRKFDMENRFLRSTSK